MNFRVVTKSSEETIELGKKLASVLSRKDVITLTGDLGAGKTTFVSGVAKGLNIDEEVLSPTFNILKCYFSTPISLFHIDAYRLESVNKDIGLEEFIENDDGVTFIEWPKFISDLLNVPHLEIEIRNLGFNTRQFTFKTSNEDWEIRIKSIL